MKTWREAYEGFDIGALERELLSGSLASGVNAAVECCDRWAESDRRALRFAGKDGARIDLSYAGLRRDSARFAAWLAAEGIGRGDVVAGLLPRTPELLVAVLGAWRLGAVWQPLFTAFGPQGIELRIAEAGGSGAKLIVTDRANAPKLEGLAARPRVIVADRAETGPEGFAARLAAFPEGVAPVILTGEDPFILLYTSGTTGAPKGVLYPLRGLLAIGAYMRDGIGFRADEPYWNVADAGWAYGMLYAVTGPLLLGGTTTLSDGPFEAEAAVSLLREFGIRNLAAAPTVYKLLKAAGPEAVAPIRGQIRVASSAGEPLNPEIVRWAARELGCPLRDHYGQSETMMLANNHHGLAHEAKAGAAGLAMPGFHLEILGEDLKPKPRGEPGILAVDLARSPLNPFAGYFRAPTPSIREGWYLTGDSMLQDEDGHFVFVGRSDDIITSSGYRIGPFEVESTLMEHEAVAEVAVIGKPDPERTEIVKAFVVLRAGFAPSEELTKALQAHVRKRMAAHAFPREIAYLDALPKTPSGKVQRFVLRREP